MDAFSDISPAEQEIVINAIVRRGYDLLDFNSTHVLGRACASPRTKKGGEGPLCGSFRTSAPILRWLTLPANILPRRDVFDLGRAVGGPPRTQLLLEPLLFHH